jgi:hypothetical protein
MDVAGAGAGKSVEPVVSKNPIDGANEGFSDKGLNSGGAARVADEPSLW